MFNITSFYFIDEFAFNELWIQLVVVRYIDQQCSKYSNANMYCSTLVHCCKRLPPLQFVVAVEWTFESAFLSTLAHCLQPLPPLQFVVTIKWTFGSPFLQIVTDTVIHWNKLIFFCRTSPFVGHVLQRLHAFPSGEMGRPIRWPSTQMSNLHVLYYEDHSPRNLTFWKYLIHMIAHLHLCVLHNKLLF